MFEFDSFGCVLNALCLFLFLVVRSVIIAFPGYAHLFSVWTLRSASNHFITDIRIEETNHLATILDILGHKIESCSIGSHMLINKKIQ